MSRDFCLGDHRHRRAVWLRVLSRASSKWYSQSSLKKSPDLSFVSIIIIRKLHVSHHTRGFSAILMCCLPVQ